MGFCCLGITEKSYTANRSCLTSKEQNATTENGAVKARVQVSESKTDRWSLRCSSMKVKMQPGKWRVGNYVLRDHQNEEVDAGELTEGD